VRIHLGHHFYGAGNLGDDFMLAGFLGALRTLAPDTTFTACVPFPLDPLRQRFPAIEWLPCDDAARTRCIEACDVWLGLGGSPFQSEQSRWFLDHLVGEQERCHRAGKPMYFLGVGVQQAAEVVDPALQRLCAGAAGIWTRDTASAERLRTLPASPPVADAADLAHLYFAHHAPPPAAPGRLTVVLNFDYGGWPGQSPALAALRELPAADRVWLAQETRALPGAERSLFAALAPDEQARWRLVAPEVPGCPLHDALARWPSGEWLVTARYHAAIAGAWSGSRIVVIGTNEKLRGAARELSVPLLSPSANVADFARALAAATPTPPPHLLAAKAHAACAAFVRSAVAHQR
jgi:hypothetical protein